MPHNNYRISNTTEEFIISRKRLYEIKTEQYIYFLIHENKIVYVEQTQSINQRLGTHSRNKIFDSFSFFDVSKPPFESRYHINDIETFFILKFRPKYNQTAPKSDVYLSIKLYYGHLIVKYQMIGVWFNRIMTLYGIELTIIGPQKFTNRFEFEKAALDYKALYEKGNIK